MENIGPPMAQAVRPHQGIEDVLSRVPREAQGG